MYSKYGTDYNPVPQRHLDRFPRKNIRKPIPEGNLLNGWTTLCDISDTQPNDGPLTGMTFAVKDNYTVAGMIANNGSKACGDWVPVFDAEIVVRCLEAGATVSFSPMIDSPPTAENAGPVG
jgi:hypothetical protein